MIFFKKCRWKNFLSTGDQFIEVDFLKSPLTLIVGNNGAGKSTLLDALCFSLFNRPFRKLKKDQLVNSINDKDCLIEVEFKIGTKEYLIRRGIKPNLFEIFENGELLNQDATTTDYQKVLENNIMKLNYRSFIQVVILGSSSYEPFMKLGARYRREVVEEILDIRVFSLMDIILRTRQGDLSKELIEMEHNVKLLDEKYNIKLDYFNKAKDQSTLQTNELRKDLEEAQIELKKYTETVIRQRQEVDFLNSTIEDKKDIINKIKKLESLEAKVENNAMKLKKDLDFFNENDDCPVCKQSIEEDYKSHMIKHKKETITNVESGLKKLIDEVVINENRLNSIHTIEEKARTYDIAIAKNTSSISSLENQIHNLNSKLESITNNKDDVIKLEAELEQIKVLLAEAKEKLQKESSLKEYIDTARGLLNDEGIKAKIIKKYLDPMNQLINKYLQAMDFFISFHLDEQFKETIKSRGREDFSYENFSEGEKMRIDLALLFTWRQIAKMKNSTNTNLLILDEIFDSSLDMQGTDFFFKLIKSLPKENVFIISHKGDILFDKFTNIIKFEKDRNFTKQI